MGQFPKPLHPFHPSHPSFVLFPFLGLLRSPPFSWPCVCSVGFGGWRVRPVIIWSLMVLRKPIPAASFIFETTLKHMEAWIGDRKLFWKYVKKYCFDVCVSFYLRKLFLTNKTYSITWKTDAPHHIPSCTCFSYFQNHNRKEILIGSTRETVSTVLFLLSFSNSVFHYVLQQLYSVLKLYHVLENLSLALLCLTCYGALYQLPSDQEMML